MDQTYRIALWQGPSPEADIKSAFATLGQAMRAAGAMGAKMLVAPELYLPGYNQDSLTDLAQDLSALKPSCSGLRIFRDSM